VAQSPPRTASPTKADPSNLPEGQDPFGSSNASFNKGAPAGEDAAQFDDGEFDFPDLPAPTATLPAATSAQNPPQAPPPAASSFDDEFATFDEEFDKAPSQNSLQSYEVVPSPQQAGASNFDEWGLNSETKPANAGNGSNFSFDDAFGQPQQQQQQTIPGGFDDAFGQSQQPAQQQAAPQSSFNDAFGFSQQPPAQGGAGNQFFDDAFGASQAGAGPTNPTSKDAFSFDDAFGGSFAPGSEPTNAGPSNGGPSIAGTAPPTGGDSVPPALPKRPTVNKDPSTSDLPQPDDLKEVKRLCDMGFPRSLVVEALDANGYDFQKALNVLLVK
jgi:epidermal growth factor receptor substrate 15